MEEVEVEVVEQKQRKPGTFVKGDPRINRSGRPKVFDALRAIAQEIAAEPVLTRDGTPLVINDHTVDVAEAIMRSWAQSDNPNLQKAFIEIAFGRVPTPIDVDLTSAGRPLVPLESFSEEEIAFLMQLEHRLNQPE